MTLTTEQTERLRIASQPLMILLNSPEFHPHIRVVVTSRDAEVFESLAKVNNEPDKGFRFRNNWFWQFR